MTVLGRLPLRGIFVAIFVLAALALAVLPVSGLTSLQGQTLGIVLLTLGLWVTAAVPNYLASLIFFAVTLILGLAQSDVVFAGFSSAAVWLIVSGFVIGSAITLSGLSSRFAQGLGPLLGTSYTRLIAGLMLATMILGFVMPSSVGRAVIMVPIGMALATRLGFASGSNGRIGVAVILAIGCNMPSFAILPSNIPNMILAGAAETIHGVRFGYTEYLALHYPVLGLLKAAIIVALVLWLFPDRIEPAAETVPAPATEAGAGLAAQMRVLMILVATLLLWMTDSLHGINPAWVGIAAAALLLMPGVGVVTPPAFKASVDFGMLLFVAGALALGALVNASGLGTMFGSVMQQILPLEQGRAFFNFVSLVLMSGATGLFATVPGSPAVLTPMAGPLAELTGFSLPAVLMTQVIGFSTVFFPYQIPPLVVAMQLSGERLGSLLKVTLPLAAITLLVLLPLDYLWWRLLGWI